MDQAIIDQLQSLASPLYNLWNLHHDGSWINLQKYTLILDELFSYNLFLIPISHYHFLESFEQAACPYTGCLFVCFFPWFEVFGPAYTHFN